MMDKEKVLNNLMDIREIADNVNHPINEDEKDKCMQAIVDVAGETIKEVNSKPVMPKVWTDWLETYNLPQNMMVLELAKLYNGRIRNQLDVDLYNAIVSKDNVLTVWDCLNAIRSECEPSNI